MFAPINGIQMFYDVLGDGPPILAVHGGPGLGDHRNNRKYLAEPLKDAYRVVVYDLRGCGQSEGRPPYTHEQFAADLDGLRRHLGFDKVVVMGISYGGFISLEYALRYQEHLAALVVFDTAASGRFDRQAMQRALAAGLPGVDREGLLRLFEGRVRDDADLKELFGAILPLYEVRYDPEEGRKRLDSIRFRHETHNAAFSYNLPRYDIVKQLARVRVPTWVGVGRHDWITPVEAAQEIAQAIPGAELTIFEQSGHHPQVEEPARFLASVRDFLRRRAQW